MRTIPAHVAAARRWAAETLQNPRVVILDTETTGLDRLAEIVQVAVITTAGEVLLEQLVRPARPIPPAATAIHGITNEQVASAAYDLRVLTTSAELAGNPPAAFAPLTGPQTRALFGVGLWTCAMHWYSQWCGEWNSRATGFRSQRLPGGDHTALGDARATLEVIRRMAAD